MRIVGDSNSLEYPIGKVILQSEEEGILSPRFSPRGDQIAFYQKAGRSYSLAIVNASGKEKRTLAGGWSDLYGVPCWAPDGREIWIAVARPGETSAFYAVDLAGKLRLVMRVPGSLELEDISRDGRVLAAHHTVVQILAGLPPDEEKQHDLSWLDGSVPADLSADGKTLVFTETGEGSGERPSVYLRRTDGSPALRLGEGTAIALSPDGKSVLVSVRSAGGKAESLVLLPTGAGETRTLKNDRLEFFGGGAWLPDGKRIVFAANEKGHQARIYVQDIEGGLPRPIAAERTWIRAGTNPVSPDGKLIFSVWQGVQASLIPIEGGDPRPVAGLEAQEIPIQWSADGSSLYVHTRPGNPNKVWQLDPASGSRRALREISPIEPVLGLPQLRMSRDGKSYVYGTFRTSSELYVVEGLR